MESRERKKLDDDIEAIDEVIEDMTPEDFERVIKGNSREAFDLRRKRKKIRYRLSRIQTAELGGPAAEDVGNLKEQFEAMPLFGGWRWYGENWDVDLHNPMRVVHRDHSKEEEWDKIVRSKFPILGPDGRVTYPDITVKEAVERETRGRR
ncbi:MAG: hypothetical protein U9Q19_02650 [Pseudomonadota bacterium]|nr:hypothetical protein [Pseudomonadota bacterium]